jgi:hypothetical protein
MDEKLAQGLARALLYRLTKNRLGDLWTPVHDEVLRAYYVNGGIRETSLSSWALAIKKAIPQWPEMRIEQRLIRHPIRRKVVVGLSWPRSPKSGGQRWLTNRRLTYIFQRQSLQIIETMHNVGISHHAMSRIFQRNNTREVNVSDLLDQATLWTPILLFVMQRLDGDDMEVAIPFKNGLLLGAIEIFSASDEGGPTIVEIGPGSHNTRALQMAFKSEDGDVATVSIYTYIGAAEMFPNQIQLYNALSDFEKRYKNTMARFRDGCSLGFPDPAVTEIMKPVRLSSIENATIDELGAHMRTFFESAEWRRHVQGRRYKKRFPKADVD